MTEYINTTTLLKEIDHAFHTDTIGKKDVINLIINLPVADVTPVRHGRWIDKGGYAVCMECGGRSGTQYDGVEPIPLMTQFCPNCGCHMDGGVD